MRDLLSKLLQDEDGATTVDWVVLTAAIVGLGFSVIYSMANGSETLADNLSAGIGGINVAAGD